MSRKKILEVSVAETIAEALDNHWFNPAILADILVTDYPLYTQDKLIEMIAYIIRFEQQRFEAEWATGNTSEGLMLASHLNDVLDQHEYLEAE